MDSSKINFSVRESENAEIGVIVITGLTMPRARNYDPLGKLWASLRKRFYEWHDVDSTGIFSYDKEQGIILCNFILNKATITGANQVEYDKNALEKTQRFRQRFRAQIHFFEKMVKRFADDPINGYDNYCRLVEYYDSITGNTEADVESRKCCLEAIDDLFDAFLISVKAKKAKKSEKGKTSKKAPAGS